MLSEAIDKAVKPIAKLLQCNYMEGLGIRCVHSISGNAARIEG